MAWASTVAVVVPSPATSEVLEATSLSIWAPMFSYLSFSSISLATVTPSLVMVGLPNFLSMTTLRPLGPRVALTASAIMFTPRSNALRASSSNFSCLGMDHCPPCRRGSRALFEDGEDVFLAQDQILVPVDLDLGTRVLAEQDAIAALDVEGDPLAIIADLAESDGDDLALLGLLLGGVGNDDAAGADFFFLLALHEDAVMQRTDVHSMRPPWFTDGGLAKSAPTHEAAGRHVETSRLE